MPVALRPALLLDRDGVINVDRGFVCRLDDFEWLPGIFDVARAAVRLGMPIVVVTNQSGIGRGYYTEADFQAITAHMRERFAAESAAIAAVYHCPFHPEAVEARYLAPDHPWRKPRPGMILAARDELGLDLAGSVMIGDRLVDLQAGAAAGVATLALIAATELPGDGHPPHRRFASLAPIAPWLEQHAARYAGPAPARIASRSR